MVYVLQREKSNQQLVLNLSHQGPLYIICIVSFEIQRNALTEAPVLRLGRISFVDHKTIPRTPIEYLIGFAIISVLFCLMCLH